jgi:hypothetical protein
VEEVTSNTQHSRTSLFLENEPENSASVLRGFGISAGTVLLLTVAAVAWLGLLLVAMRKPLAFDDSFMFYRYAMNMRHGLGILVATIAFALFFPRARLTALDRRLEGNRFAYDPPMVRVRAVTPLPPVDWLQAIDGLTQLVAQRLPYNSTIAATEVGWLGAGAPQVNVIDLARLNDREIALHGFDVAVLLARKPDLIWMPHPDYTYQRGLMLSNADLLNNYNVYDGAAGYGLAVRKDSPSRNLIDQQLQKLWGRFYPGRDMSDYLVQSVTWNPQKHLIDTAGR